MMIYYRVESLEEALEVFGRHEGALYYSGGTEIVSMRRMGRIDPSAVIDLSGIDSYRRLEKVGEAWSIGGGVTLNTIASAGIPLLSEVAGKIADHTVRNAITLAGNVCGRLPYREAAAALLVLDAQVEIASTEGFVVHPMRGLFDKRMQLEQGTWVHRFILTVKAGRAVSKRITEHGSVDYPIVHMMGLASEGQIQMGCAGLSPYPFIFEGPVFEHAHPIVEDQRASRAYRRHLAQVAFDEVKEGLR